MPHLRERCVLPLLLAVMSPALAQRAAAEENDEPEPEVVVKETGRHGGWIAPVVQLSTVRDRAAVFAGGRGGWLFDGRFTLGGGGLGLVNRIPAPAAVEGPGEELELEMGYGGVWLEYAFAPVRVLHVAIGTLVGGGGLSLAFRDGGSYGSGSESFFVAEPAVMGELNLARSLRVDLGVAYRWIVGVDMEGLSHSDIAGFSAVAVLKFGKF